jgi:hypothetical protein
MCVRFHTEDPFDLEMAFLCSQLLTGKRRACDLVHLDDHVNQPFDRLSDLDANSERFVVSLTQSELVSVRSLGCSKHERFYECDLDGRDLDGREACDLGPLPRADARQPIGVNPMCVFRCRRVDLQGPPTCTRLEDAPGITTVASATS